MRASDWEFKQRATLFGIIIGGGFFLYSVDHQGWIARFANVYAPRWSTTPETLARMVVAAGMIITIVGAAIRTWASAYLHSDIVYASSVKSESLVADGPYRRVRNPLYLGNVLMALGMAPMMSLTGAIFAVVATPIFCLRLIGREEQDLELSQGDAYRRYCGRVPRLLPALTPRIPSAGSTPRWAAGFIAELWFWGFASALAAFAITLKMIYFLVLIAASLALLSASSWMVASKSAKSAR